MHGQQNIKKKYRTCDKNLFLHNGKNKISIIRCFYTFITNFISIYFTWWVLLTALEPSRILQRFAPYTWPTASHCFWHCLLPCSHVQRRPIDILIYVQAEKFDKGKYSVHVQFMILAYHWIIPIENIKQHLRYVPTDRTLVWATE